MSSPRDLLSPADAALLQLGMITLSFGWLDLVLDALLIALAGDTDRWKERSAFGRKLGILQQRLPHVAAQSAEIGAALEAWSEKAGAASKRRNQALKSLMVYSGAGPLQATNIERRFVDVSAEDLAALARDLDRITTEGGEIYRSALAAGFYPAAVGIEPGESPGPFLPGDRGEPGDAALPGLGP
jgi:hypothetical protein